MLNFKFDFKYHYLLLLFSVKLEANVDVEAGTAEVADGRGSLSRS